MTDLVTRLLGTSAADAGCEGGLAVMAEYVELELEGRDPHRLFPALAEHLRNCKACADDHSGLVALLRDQHR